MTLLHIPFDFNCQMVIFTFLETVCVLPRRILFPNGIPVCGGADGKSQSVDSAFGLNLPGDCKALFVLIWSQNLQNLILEMLKFSCENEKNRHRSAWRFSRSIDRIIFQVRGNK
jgi:hypothetical protein